MSISALLALLLLLAGCTSAQEPFNVSTCGECVACEGSIIVPVVLAVCAVLLMVGLILYLGSKRIGASLFEKTAIAEQSAKLAIHEAQVFF